MIEKLSKL